MKLAVHLQFLIMMTPTLLLLVAAVVTLALPAESVREPATIAQVQSESWE